MSEETLRKIYFFVYNIVGTPLTGSAIVSAIAYLVFLFLGFAEIAEILLFIFFGTIATSFVWLGAIRILEKMLIKQREKRLGSMMQSTQEQMIRMVLSMKNDLDIDAKDVDYVVQETLKRISARTTE